MDEFIEPAHECNITCRKQKQHNKTTFDPHLIEGFHHILVVSIEPLPDSSTESPIFWGSGVRKKVGWGSGKKKKIKNSEKSDGREKAI